MDAGCVGRRTWGLHVGKEEKERDGRRVLNSQPLFGVLGMVGDWELQPRPRLSNLLVAPSVEVEERDSRI